MMQIKAFVSDAQNVYNFTLSHTLLCSLAHKHSDQLAPETTTSPVKDFPSVQLKLFLKLNCRATQLFHTEQLNQDGQNDLVLCPNVCRAADCPVCSHCN